MDTNLRRYGKIAHGLRGSGTVTPEMVEQRARELAVINGRDRFNQDDLNEAKNELLGMENPIDEQNEPELETASNFRKNANSGAQTPAVTLPDPQKQLEELVQGGMDEAEHDSMLKGARAAVNQE